MSRYEFDNFNTEEILIVFSKAYFDYIFKQKDCVNLHALYSFYLYQTSEARNPIYLSDKFISKEMKWSEEKVLKVKRKLRDINLIDFNEGYLEPITLKIPRVCTQ